MKILVWLTLSAAVLGWAIYTQRRREIHEAPDKLARLRKLLGKAA